MDAGRGHDRMHRLHFLAIAAIVALEYLQNGLVSFSSAYIMGGIGAAPEEFSLAAAFYASVAVLMIFQHRRLAAALGYRRFLHLSLAAFIAGALICMSADDVPVFILGRMAQAVGASTLFTASRVQVLHHPGAERPQVMTWFGYGIFLGMCASAVTASAVIEQFGWRAIFVVMVAAALGVAALVECTVPEHEPLESEDHGPGHPVGALALALGIFVLQIALVRTRYDYYAHPGFVVGLCAAGLLSIAVFIVAELRHDRPLVPFRQFVNGRYVVGLVAYTFFYVVGASSAFAMPVFLIQGLGFAVKSTGGLLSLSASLSLLAFPLVLRQLRHGPSRHILAALLALLVYGVWMSRLSEEVSQRQLLPPLLLINSLVLTLALPATALATFRDVEETHFAHAYLTKNGLREVANACGVSLTALLLQSRSTLHYVRLVEVADPLHEYAGAAPGALARLAALVTREATLMACQDYFMLLAAAALAAALAVTGAGLALTRAPSPDERAA